MTGPLPLTRLSADDEQWRVTVRAFAEDTVRPLARTMDDVACLRADLLRELFAAGLMGIEISTSYGGAGRSLFQVVLAIEELARVDPAVAVVVDVQNALVASALLRHGSGDQKRRYLPRLATGAVGAYAISEAEAGSDALSVRTRATRDGTGYRLDGTKAWVTNAAEASLFLIFARLDGNGDGGGLTAFLVSRDEPGLSVGPRVGKLGIRASSTCEVRLDGVRIGGHDVLGRPGGAEVLAVETLNVGKLGIAAQLTGLAAGALSEAVGYARQRRQFGVPVADFQGVRFPLARLAAETEAARVLLYNTARVLEHGTAGEQLQAAAMAKYVASVTAERVAAHAVEILGGNGFTTRYLAEKFYRDAKIGTIYEGTSNMQFRTISSALLGPARTAHS
jgi:short/branched chain acyl-CoA dehydrogenase